MIRWILVLLALLSCSNMLAQPIPSSTRSVKAIQSVKASLIKALSARGFEYGAPIFIRIFKATSKLEVWVKKDQVFELFREYEICTFSGDLGPKIREGDWQSPEGFYFVKPANLNPWSSYHLSFNLGYPNLYDRVHGRTGSALMVHGKCVSIGCFAMTDEYIDEIYALANAAFENGQPFFRVHSFPFKLEPGALEAYQDHKWYGFWKNLQQGYDYFNQKGVPPNVTVSKQQYQFE